MLNKFIHSFRHYGHPDLKEVNGLLNLTVIAFGFFNLILGACLFVQSAVTKDFFIINDLFTYQVWGVVFFSGGLSLLIGRWLNYWTMMRQTLLFLLFTKFIWLSALLARQFTENNPNPFLLLFFALATVVQMGMYIYFPIYNKVNTWKE